MKENPVAEKSKAFALRIIGLYKYLCDEKHEFVMSKQILRSGTSIGANLAEAECAVSRKDFTAKIYIALKVLEEVKILLKFIYWMGQIILNHGYYKFQQN